MAESIEQKMVAAYMEAELKVLQGKTVTLNGRSVGRENLADIRRGRQEWERKLRNKSRKSGASLADFR